MLTRSDKECTEERDIGGRESLNRKKEERVNLFVKNEFCIKSWEEFSKQISKFGL